MIFRAFFLFPAVMLAAGAVAGELPEKPVMEPDEFEKACRREFEEFTRMIGTLDAGAETCLALKEKRSAKVIYADEKIISYQLSFASYCGGAHGSAASYFGTIVRQFGNDKTGKLKLCDIASVSQLPVIQKKILAAFLQELRKNKCSHELAPDGTIVTGFPLPKPTENFYYDAKGLHFFYNPCEIHCCASGPFDLCIDWPRPEEI